MNNEELDFYSMGIREAKDASKQIKSVEDLILSKYGETAKAEFEAGVLKTLSNYVEKTNDDLDDALEARGLRH